MKENYFEFMLSGIAQFKEDNRRSSMRAWRNALKSFKEATGLKELSVERLSRKLLSFYRDYLLCHGMSRNTINSYMGALQAAYNRMTLGKKCHVYGLFKGLRTAPESKVKRAVKERPMARITQIDPATLPEKLRWSFDWFLLMFYLRGIPFVDLAHLRKTDLRDGNIIYRRKKTGRELTVQLIPEAYGILEKYRTVCPDSPYLLPILRRTGTTVEEAWREYQRALRHFNFDLAALSVFLHTEVHLSSYTARHTWATIAYHQGISIGIISKALGHSSIRVTEFYLKPFENTYVDKTNRQVIRRMKQLVE